jgi:protease I
MADQLNGKKIAFLTANEDVEEVELNEPRKAVEEAGAETELLAPKEGDVKAFNHLDKGQTYTAARAVGDVTAAEFDGLVLSGGVANPDDLRTHPEAGRVRARIPRRRQARRVICHGPWTLVEADVVKGRRLTSWPSLQTDLGDAGADWVGEEVVVDENSSRAANPKTLTPSRRR